MKRASLFFLKRAVFPNVREEFEKLCQRNSVSAETELLDTNHSFVAIATQAQHVSTRLLEREKEEEELLGHLSYFLSEASKVSPVELSVRVVQVVSRSRSTEVSSCRYLFCCVGSSL